MFGKILEAAIGMANRRDGGIIIIGIEDKFGKLTPIGLSNEDLGTWKYDDVIHKINSYADPSISLTLEIYNHDSKKFVVLFIQEFDSIPILTKQQYQCQNGNGVSTTLIRQGACLVRSRRKPETTEVATQEDMRDLLDLATEKRLRVYISTAHKAGISLIPSIESIQQPNDDDLFRVQKNDFTL